VSDRPDLDICTCGDFRRDHEGGVGGCLLPFCAQHGMPQCRAFTFANAVTESDRLYQESIEARRPLPVSTLLSTRQEPIHRDPGAARAARSVKVSDKLPDEVLKLLGDDATPERAASRMQSAADWSAKVAGARSRTGEYDASTVDAASAYSYALSAAAIRECEASREANAAVSEIPGDPEKVDITQEALGAAMKEYDALRNCRKTP